MKRNKLLWGAAAAMVIAGTACSAVFGAGKTAKTNLYDKDVGNGIHYNQMTVTEGKLKKLVNVVSCDLNNGSSDIVFSKAKDIEKKMEVLSKQVQREVFKGNNVVAGINADMFDTSVGFSSGPQIMDGAILTNHNAKSEENIYPVFGIDNDKKAFIDYIHMTGKLSVVSTTPEAIAVTTLSGIGSTNVMQDGVAIDSVNRDNCKEKIVLVNGQLNETGEVDLTPYVTKGMSCITVVKGIQGSIQLNTDYEGTVESVGYGLKKATIPKDGVLLCSTGTKAAWMNTHLKAGSTVRVNISYSRPNMKQVIGAYTYFLRDGKVLTNNDMIKYGANAGIVKARKARTAIGITRSNKVFAITVDGGTPSKGISDGITLNEMAVLLKSLGAVNGVGFDGGGSTEMNVKKYGDTATSAVNKPSDGRERALTNAILFVSNNIRTYQAANIAINGDISIYKNTSYSFSASGMDTSFNQLDLSHAQIAWSVSAGLGKIDQNGVFVSGNASASGKVTAVLGQAMATSNIRVLSTLGSLKLSESGTVPIQTNVTHQFAISAFDGNKKSMLISNTAGVWTVTPSIGKIDKNGLLTVTAKSGKGVVTVAVGGKKASVKVAVMEDATLIDNFEHGDNARYFTQGNMGIFGFLSADYTKSGKYSYKLSYDYDKGWDRKSDGTFSLVPSYVDKDGNDMTGLYTSELKPKKLAMWIYGDGTAPKLSASLQDGDNATKSILIIKAVNWTGWKYIEADIPADISYPVTLNSLDFVETDKNKHKKGTVYIDDISYVYSEGADLRAPEVSDFGPLKVYAGNAKFTMKISDSSGINRELLDVKLDGGDVKYDYDESTGLITVYAENLFPGNHKIRVGGADKVGNLMNPSFAASFSVSAEKDTAPPVISNLLPNGNLALRTDTPRLSVLIKDDKTGVAGSAIRMTLDGTLLPVYYDEGAGIAFCIPPKLTPGSHRLMVEASDRAGNLSAPATAGFSIAPVPQPKDPDHFTVSALSDSHGTAFGNDFLDLVNGDASELVLQNGDLVDVDSKEAWANAKKQLGRVTVKPVLLTPGSGEASQGTDDNFYKNMGLATYSVEYGNSLFISLNSSIGQSIDQSDPTQFEYLRRLLAANQKTNVFVFTSVPTRDSSGQGYALPDEDRTHLENILTEYKKNNPGKNLQVVFGHLHAYKTWQVGGVSYTIDGNGCAENIINTNSGGYLGYTQFVVNGSVVTRKYIPVPQKIAVEDAALTQGVMRMVKGGFKKLSLYGDFTRYSADYIAKLNSVTDADIVWSSDNPDIVQVSGDGVLTAKSEGEANIMALCGGKSYPFKVICWQEVPGMLCGLTLTADKMNLMPGAAMKLTVTAYDLYGETILVDSNYVNWTTTGGSILGGSFTMPKDAATGANVVISASYGGLTSSLTISSGSGGTAPTLPKNRFVKVTATSLNIRESAAASSAVIGKLSFGDRVMVIGETGSWFKVSVDGKTGYLSRQYTKEDQ